MQPEPDDSLAKALREAKALAELRTKQLVASTSSAYSFLDSLHMGFIMCDIDTEVVLTNRSAEVLLSQGRPAGRSLDMAAVDRLFRPQLGLKELVEQVLKSMETVEHKGISRGQFVVNLFVAPLISEVSPDNRQPIGAVILIENITEQAMLDRAKDEFFSIASHELRTPLTAIRGNTALIKKYYTEQLPDKDMAEMIDDIHESSVRLIGIVNDFLDAAALEQGKLRLNPQPAGLAEIVSAVVREMHGLCEAKGIGLAADPGMADMPLVLADAQRIKQVIINLVGNAIKFTGQGGVTVSCRADDSFVYTAVTDTGKGMTPENQRFLFHKFQQAGDSLLTRDTTRGTGLGLYISKLIVDQSGGRIGLARSEPGAGSSFVFSLPRAGQ